MNQPYILSLSFKPTNSYLIKTLHDSLLAIHVLSPPCESTLMYNKEDKSFVSRFPSLPCENVLYCTIDFAIDEQKYPSLPYENVRIAPITRKQRNPISLHYAWHYRLL